MNDYIALKVDPSDNIATLFANDVPAGSTVSIRGGDGGTGERTLRAAIPYGHKFALCDIPKGSLIRKYGEVIGKASCDIQTGEHVHVHNMESMRGRGDMEGGAQR